MLLPQKDPLKAKGATVDELTGSSEGALKIEKRMAMNDRRERSEGHVNTSMRRRLVIRIPAGEKEEGTKQRWERQPNTR